MVKKILIAAAVMSFFLLVSCDEEWEKDNTPIPRNDFAMIQLETDICRHATMESSCLRHLKARIQ